MLLLVLTAASCGGGSPEKRAREAVESVRSWSGTMRLAGEMWLAGKAPSPYTRMTFEKAAESLETEFDALRKEGVPAPLRADLGRLRAPADAARRLARAVERGDSSLVRQELGALAVEAAGLEALERRLPGSGR